MKNADARTLYRRFYLRTVLFTDGISYFIIIPIASALYLNSVTLTPGQVRAFIITVGIVALAFLVLNAIWYAFLMRPIKAFCLGMSSGSEIGESITVALRERFNSFNVLCSVSIVARWTAGLLLVSLSVSLISGLRFTQLLNLWITGAGIITTSLIHYNYATRHLINRFSNEKIFEGIHGVLSPDTKTLMGSLAGQIASGAMAICFVLCVILTVTAIKVAHSALEEMNAALAGSSAAVSLDEYSLRLALWMSGMAAFWITVASFLLYKSFSERFAPLKRLRESMVAYARGNFTEAPFLFNGGNEIGMLSTSMEILAGKIRGIVGEIANLSAELASSSEEMASTSEMFSESAQGEAANAEEITASMEEMSASIGSVAGSTESLFSDLMRLIEKMQELSRYIHSMSTSVKETFTVTQSIASDIKAGEQSLKKMNDTMNTVTHSSSDMMNIVNIINDISDRINLLSLNASIEAARAGEAGRGFAVVAEEVSKLADQTAQSISSITSLISMSSGEISTAMSEIVGTTDILGRIISGVNTIENGMERINTAMSSQMQTNQSVQESVKELKSRSEDIKISTGEQKIAVYEITQTMNTITHLSETYASGAEQIASSSEMVAKMAADLKSSVDFFRI